MMKKTAYIFPGQGSQFSGMGKMLWEQNYFAKKLFLKANEVLGFDICEIMFNGTAEDLKQTKVTQPAVFLHSVILALSLFEKEKVEIAALAGHSLGELSALVAGGYLSFEAGLSLVCLRAKAMQKCCEENPGSMAAILNLDLEEIQNICEQVPGIVGIANLNSKTQIVISGENEAVSKACELCKERGAKRALPLPVSGAFHSPLMLGAQDELAKAINSITFQQGQIPVYQNVTAQASTDIKVIKENLLAQLTSPVKWYEIAENMYKDGINNFVELGPGKVLQNLLSKTLPADAVELHSFEKLD